MKADRFTTRVVDTIIETIATEHGVIDVPQNDDGAFRKLIYLDDPEEIIPMEIWGNETEITFEVLKSEHTGEYGERIAPFLYGVVRSLVDNIMTYDNGTTGAVAEFNDKGEITFVV